MPIWRWYPSGEQPQLEQGSAAHSWRWETRGCKLVHLLLRVWFINANDLISSSSLPKSSPMAVNSNLDVFPCCRCNNRWSSKIHFLGSVLKFHTNLHLQILPFNISSLWWKNAFSHGEFQTHRNREMRIVMPFCVPSSKHHQQSVILLQPVAPPAHTDTPHVCVCFDLESSKNHFQTLWHFGSFF